MRIFLDANVLFSAACSDGAIRRLLGLLLEEFLKPMGLGQVEAARRLGISLNRLNEIVLGKRGISADTALRLGRLLKTSPQFWMRLQADWDLHEAMRREARCGRRT